MTHLGSLRTWNSGYFVMQHVAGGSQNIIMITSMGPFKLYRVYLEPFNSSNVGDFSWSWILKGFIHVQIEKGKLS